MQFIRLSRSFPFLAARDANSPEDSLEGSISLRNGPLLRVLVYMTGKADMQSNQPDISTLVVYMI